MLTFYAILAAVTAVAGIACVITPFVVNPVFTEAGERERNTQLLPLTFVGVALLLTTLVEMVVLSNALG